MVGSTGVTVWTISSLYWSLGAILGLLSLLVVGATAAMAIQVIRHRRRDVLVKRSVRRIDELLDQMQARGVDTVDGQDGPPRGSYRRLMAKTLHEQLDDSEGRRRKALSVLYQRLGFVERDCRKANSRSWQQRLEALRRLYSIDGFFRRSVWMEGLEDHPRIRLLSAHALTRAGSLDDAIYAFNALELTSSMMEQPVYAMLGRIDDQRLRRLLGSMERIDHSRVRRAMIVRAAERDLDGLDDRLVALCESDDVAIRVGVCLAAGHRRDDFGTRLLEQLLADPSWEVRAYAAKSLATQSSQKRVNTLAWALNDPSFWHRDEASIKDDEGHGGLTIEADTVPTADDLCHFDDYLNNAVRWVPNFASRRATLGQRPTATAGGGTP